MLGFYKIFDVNTNKYMYPKYEILAQTQLAC